MKNRVKNNIKKYSYVISLVKNYIEEKYGATAKVENNCLIFTDISMILTFNSDDLEVFRKLLKEYDEYVLFDYVDITIYQQLTILLQKNVNFYNI